MRKYSNQLNSLFQRQDTSN